MDLVQGQNLHGFTVLTAEPLPEIDGTAYTLLHNISGAKLLYLQNDDDNKAFSIAFRTPPADDTGVFHILEHSVLCGSEKFPVKEPFVNLLKTSMQTFLNAMTFGDKTLYPVASTNDQDLMNLADVYMDAVLHPDIYRKRQVFEQEGWHYELVAADEADEGEAGADSEGAGAGAAARPQLAYNGVVYNEMKGALSDASSVLYDQLQASLFPDTPYAFESGGTPEAIPTLTYEHYLEEHERHYRLDNSYLTLYGNVDLDRMLAFLDERYLTPVAAEQAKRTAEREAAGLAPLEPRTLPEQAPVCALGVHRTMATAPENACMGLGYVIGHVRERTRIVACDILLDAIAGSNEAPLKRALLDAGLAGDVQAYLADSVQQPFAVIQLRGLVFSMVQFFLGGLKLLVHFQQDRNQVHVQRVKIGRVRRLRQVQTREHQQFIQQNLVILAQGALETVERGLFFVPGLGNGRDGTAHNCLSTQTKRAASRNPRAAAGVLPSRHWHWPAGLPIGWRAPG